jgi:hypothetical protein
VAGCPRRADQLVDRPPPDTFRMPVQRRVGRAPRNKSTSARFYRAHRSHVSANRPRAESIMGAVDGAKWVDHHPESCLRRQGLLPGHVPGGGTGPPTAYSVDRFSLWPCAYIDVANLSTQGALPRSPESSSRSLWPFLLWLGARVGAENSVRDLSPRAWSVGAAWITVRAAGNQSCRRVHL